MTSRKPIEEDASFMSRHKRFMLSQPKSWNLQVRAVANVLFCHAHDNGSGIYVGIERIIDMTGLSRSGVMRALRCLNECGVLSFDGVHTHANGVQTTQRKLHLARMTQITEHEKTGGATSDTSATEAYLDGATGERQVMPPVAHKPKEYNREKEPRDITPIVPKPPKTKIPDWIPIEAWNGFLEMRASIKKPLKTDRAVTLVVNKLDQLRQQGQNPGDVLDQSTSNSWQGVFAIKADFNRGSTSSRPRTAADRSDEHAAYMLEKYAGQQQ